MVSRCLAGRLGYLKACNSSAFKAGRFRKGIGGLCREQGPGVDLLKLTRRFHRQIRVAAAL
jgi:hypothetical protein